MITAQEAKAISVQAKMDYTNVINKVINSKRSKELCNATKDAANKGHTRGSLIFDASKDKVLKYLPMSELPTIGECIVKFLEDLGYDSVYCERIVGTSCELKIIWRWGGN